MSSILEKLASSSFGPVSSDHLQVVAKRAAGKFVRKESDSLQGALVDSISSENLSNNQIERVTEMANQAAWKTMFVDGGDPSAEFDPASSSEIIESLDKSPTKYEDPNIDYYSDAPTGEVQSDELLNSFRVSEDYEDYESFRPTREAEDVHEKVASANRLSIFSLDLLHSSLEVAGEELYDHVKQAHLRDGFGILQIAKAIGEVTGSEKFASSITKACANRLQGEGIIIKPAQELEKSAHAVVINTKHPLLVTAVRLEKLAESYKRAESLREWSSSELKDCRKSLLGLVSK